MPTIPALARARRHLDRRGRETSRWSSPAACARPADFVKALALGADAVAVANSAIQAIGCLGMRACHTNNCPVGIATQKPHLRARLESTNRRSSSRGSWSLGRADEDPGARLRAPPPHQFTLDDLATWKEDMSLLAGVPYGGVGLE